MSEIEKFRKTVEAYIARSGMTPTLFGKRFAADPLFVFQLRAGREPRMATRERVLAAMSEHPSERVA